LLGYASNAKALIETNEIVMHKKTMLLNFAFIFVFYFK